MLKAQMPAAMYSGSFRFTCCALRVYVCSGIDQTK